MFSPSVKDVLMFILASKCHISQFKDTIEKCIQTCNLMMRFPVVPHGRRGVQMLPGFVLRMLLQGLMSSLLGPVCKAASLGLTVAVVPLESDGGRTVGGS